MPHVTTINVFEVEAISVVWIPDGRHYQIKIEGEESLDGAIEINCWRDHGNAEPPALDIERGPEPPPEDKPIAGIDVIDPPNEEMDL